MTVERVAFVWTSPTEAAERSCDSPRLNLMPSSAPQEPGAGRTSRGKRGRISQIGIGNRDQPRAASYDRPTPVISVRTPIQTAQAFLQLISYPHPLPSSRANPLTAPLQRHSSIHGKVVHVVSRTVLRLLVMPYQICQVRNQYISSLQLAFRSGRLARLLLLYTPSHILFDRGFIAHRT